MWKITTRGLTLEEVLIMAAMNLLENAASTPKPEKRHCGNYKETKHGTEVLDKTSGSRSERFGTRIHHRSRAVKPIRSYHPGHGIFHKGHRQQRRTRLL